MAKTESIVEADLLEAPEVTESDMVDRPRLMVDAFAGLNRNCVALLM